MPERLTYDWLAAFLRRERNSLHYRNNDERSQPRPGGHSDYLEGYSTAIDGVTARLARELRNVEGFDEARFRAIIEGKENFSSCT